MVKRYESWSVNPNFKLDFPWNFSLHLYRAGAEWPWKAEKLKTNIDNAQCTPADKEILDWMRRIKQEGDKGWQREGERDGGGHIHQDKLDEIKRGKKYANESRSRKRNERKKNRTSYIRHSSRTVAAGAMKKKSFLLPSAAAAASKRTLCFRSEAGDWCVRCLCGRERPQTTSSHPHTQICLSSVLFNIQILYNYSLFKITF